ncbi:MAG: DNA polymerase III subunit delta [Puniceicoccales bacterium]|jgi:DNA polymerase-3 subunit delta|nr:DNA polymerase III subunit delta [Puniceicoccales bacterium]
MSAKFHFFNGDDEYLVERAARDFYEAISKDAAGDFSKEIVDATASKLDDAEKALELFESATQTFSLFGDKKYVWFSKMNWLSTDSPIARTEGGKLLLERLQKTLERNNPENVEIVISAFPANRTRGETKWLEKNGANTLINTAKDPSVIDKMISGECRRLGINVDAHTCQELQRKVGANTRMILSELEKLTCYLGKNGGAISSEMIATLVPTFGEGDFFEPVELFFQRNLKEALNALHRFFFNEPNAGRPLLASLQNKNRLILQLRAIMDAIPRQNKSALNKNDIENASTKYKHYFKGNMEKNTLNVFSQHPFYIGKIAHSACHFTLKELMDIQFALVDCFATMLDRPNQEEAIFREMFVRCLGSGNPGHN